MPEDRKKSARIGLTVAHAAEPLRGVTWWYARGRYARSFWRRWQCPCGASCPWPRAWWWSVRHYEERAT